MYGSVDGFTTFIGGATRLVASLPSTDQKYLKQLLNAASGEIDALISGWYEAPVVTTDLDAVEAARVDALLESWTYTLAAVHGMEAAGKGLTKGLMLAYKRVTTTLANVSAGKALIPFITARNRPRVSMVGDRANPIDPDVFILARGSFW